jgi:hypothetical protein
MKAIKDRVIIRKTKGDKTSGGIIITDVTRTEAIVVAATGLKENDFIVAHDACYHLLDPEQQLYYINLFEVAAVIR